MPDLLALTTVNGESGRVLGFARQTFPVRLGVVLQFFAVLCAVVAIHPVSQSAVVTPKTTGNSRESVMQVLAWSRLITAVGRVRRHGLSGRT